MAELRHIPHVLVAEPDAGNCLQLCELLQARGAVTSAAHSLTQVLSLLTLQQYHFVFVGASREAWNAEAIVQAARGGRNAAAPIAGVAQESQLLQAQLLLEAGANDVLTLPTSLQTVSRMLAHWLR